MTREEAEEIWMANQVGMFKGPARELATAVLLLSQQVSDGEESESLEDEKSNSR